MNSKKREQSRAAADKNPSRKTARSPEATEHAQSADAEVTSGGAGALGIEHGDKEAHAAVRSSIEGRDAGEHDEWSESIESRDSRAGNESIEGRHPRRESIERRDSRAGNESIEGRHSQL
jgi:hypothetical protein